MTTQTQPITFGLIAALEKEYAAMRAMLDAPAELIVPRNRVYWRGTLPAKGGGSHHVVLGGQASKCATAPQASSVLQFVYIRPGDPPP